MAAAQAMPTLFEMPAATPAATEAEPAPVATPSSVASENSLFELDAELDFLLEQIEDEIEEHGEATPESMKRIQLFCQAMNVKVDRIGHYITMMESRIEHCRKQASRYAQRAAREQNKIDRTKKMVLEYLAIHEMKKIESNDFTLRSQKNSQDSVIIKDPATIPPFLKRFEAKVDGPLWLSVVRGACGRTHHFRALAGAIEFRHQGVYRQWRRDRRRHCEARIALAHRVIGAERLGWITWPPVLLLLLPKDGTIWPLRPFSLRRAGRFRRLVSQSLHLAPMKRARFVASDSPPFQ